MRLPLLSAPPAGAVLADTEDDAVELAEDDALLLALEEDEEADAADEDEDDAEAEDDALELEAADDEELFDAELFELPHALKPSIATILSDTTAEAGRIFM